MKETEERERVRKESTKEKGMNSDKTNRKILNRKDINIESKRKYKGSMKEKEKENIK